MWEIKIKNLEDLCKEKKVKIFEDEDFMYLIDRNKEIFAVFSIYEVDIDEVKYTIEKYKGV